MSLRATAAMKAEARRRIKLASKLKGADDDDIEWNVTVEILLFCAMAGHKPVGVNRHFMMASIHEKFSNYIKKQITSKPLWDHLDTMYDMAALHESEIIPFPNDDVEFELPAEDFKEIAEERLGIVPWFTKDSDSKSKSVKKIDPPKPRTPTFGKTKNYFLTGPYGAETTTPLTVNLNKTPNLLESDINFNPEVSLTKAKTDLCTPVSIKSPKLKPYLNASSLSKLNKAEMCMYAPQVKLETSVEAQMKVMAKEESNLAAKKMSKPDSDKSVVESGKKPKEIGTYTKKVRSNPNIETVVTRRNSKGETISPKKKAESECNKKHMDGSMKGKSEGKSTSFSSNKNKQEEGMNDNSMMSTKTTKSPPKIESSDVGMKIKRTKGEDMLKTKRRRM